MIPAFVATATTPAQDIQTSLVSGLTSISGDMTSTISAILPTILGVVGLVMVVRFGIKMFKSLTSPTR